MARKDNYALLYRVADYYYNDGLSQDEIAKIENFSRPHVSRLLDRAKELGIVKINVIMPEILSTDMLAEELRQLLDLKAVSVCPLSSPHDEPSFEVAHHATDVLDEYLEDASCVGLGWGYTMYQTARIINHKINKENLTFVPLVGLSTFSVPYFISNNIVNLFAENTDSQGYYSSVPLIKSKEKLSDLEEMSFKGLQEQWKKIDAAILSVGGTPSKARMQRDPIATEYNEYIATVDINGVMLAHYFDAEGNVLDEQIARYFDIATYDLEDLKKLKSSICIAGGEAKVDAIIMFAKKKFFNKLITDENAARLMIEKLRQEKPEENTETEED